MVQTVMTLRDPVLAVHILTGTLGLLLGPLAMRAPKRRGRHTRVGGIYHWNMLLVAVSATALSLLAWSEIWWFTPIAIFSYANALLGYLAVKIRWKGWLPHHIAGMGGSYIALVTALLVVNAGGANLVVWLLPTIVGTPLIALAVARASRSPLARVAGAF
jgi:hypothetical protein